MVMNQAAGLLYVFVKRGGVMVFDVEKQCVVGSFEDVDGSDHVVFAAVEDRYGRGVICVDRVGMVWNVCLGDDGSQD